MSKEKYTPISLLKKRHTMNQSFFIIIMQLCLLIAPSNISAQEDYKLWLHQDAKMASSYESKIHEIYTSDNSATIQAATKEIQFGLSGLYGRLC